MKQNGGSGLRGEANRDRGLDNGTCMVKDAETIKPEFHRRVMASVNTSRRRCMEKHHFTVILEREEDGGYHAFCPALKGCHAQGETLDEALANIREAIEAYLESLRAHGEVPPVEDILIKPLEVAL